MTDNPYPLHTTDALRAVVQLSRAKAHFALGLHVLTPLYDRVVALTTRERAFKRALLDQARIEPAHQVLDVGCGTGTLAIAAQRRQPGARMSGLDADPAVLAIATRKARLAGADIAFDLGRSTVLPYADDRFDRVLSSLFFHHLSWGDKVLTAREMHRVLRPAGELHVADWGRAGGLVSRTAFLAVQLLTASTARATTPPGCCRCCSGPRVSARSKRHAGSPPSSASSRCTGP